uniref:Uncharacterized protein n=1 Tax=Opuntia streptacantha TaxID=393608 RepID=A0A7C9D256_OPUST
MPFRSKQHLFNLAIEPSSFASDMPFNTFPLVSPGTKLRPKGGKAIGRKACNIYCSLVFHSQHNSYEMAYWGGKGETNFQTEEFSSISTRGIEGSDFPSPHSPLPHFLQLTA